MEVRRGVASMIRKAMMSAKRPPGPPRGPRPPKPVDRLQNMKTIRPIGMKKWVRAHWRYDYDRRQWEWVTGHWSR